MAVSTALATEALTGMATTLRSGNTKFALLNVPEIFVGVTFAGNIGTTTSQTWTTGTRVRLQQANLFAPSIAPLNGNTDYFLIRDSATQYRLAATAANATSGTAMAVPNMAQGDYNLVRSRPSTAWTVAEIVAYELTHPLYSRVDIPATLPNTVVQGSIVQLDFNVGVINNTNAAAFAYNAIAVIKGGGNKGTTTGTLLEAVALTAVSIAQGDARSLTHRLTMQ